MAKAALNARAAVHDQDVDASALKRLCAARGVGLAILLGLAFWAGFFVCAYLCLPRSNAETLVQTPPPALAQASAQPLAQPSAQTFFQKIFQKIFQEFTQSSPPTPAQTSAHQLEQINRDVNAKMHYTRFTIGSFHGLVGSCIAYAVNKRDALIKAGWNPDRLTIWGVLDSHGERHAVLVVDDEKVLDMGSRSWASFIVDLNYVKRQGYQFLHPLNIGVND